MLLAPGTSPVVALYAVPVLFWALGVSLVVLSHLLIERLTRCFHAGR